MCRSSRVADYNKGGVRKVTAYLLKLSVVHTSCCRLIVADYKGNSDVLHSTKHSSTCKDII